MRMRSAPEGLDEVMRNLNKELKIIRGKTVGGLIEAAIIIRRDTEATPPLTPVDLGNLRSSFFVVSSKGEQSGGAPKFVGNTKSEKERAGEMTADHTALIGTLQAQAGNFKTIEKVYLGYSANYAYYVHEKLGEGGNINWSRPGSGPKWFEAAIKRNQGKIVEIVRNKAKIK